MLSKPVSLNRSGRWKQISLRLTETLSTAAMSKRASLHGTSDRARERHTLFFDGGSRGNPGPGGSGSCLCDSSGQELWEGYFYSQENSTSNAAQYDGLIQGLKAAAESGIKALRVCSHSKLVIEQMKGSWKVKSDNLRPLYDEAQQLLGLFEDVIFESISKSENKTADDLANMALKACRTHAAWMRTSQPFIAALKEKAPEKPKVKPKVRQMESSHTLYFDGGSRGNPGPGGSGSCIYDATGQVLWDGYFYQGNTTNNMAEYDGMIQGMRAAAESGIRHLRIRGDSKLVIEQMKGNWKIKSDSIRPYYHKAQELLAHFDSLIFEHVPREQNSVADSLANIAMDSRSSGESWH